MTVNSNSDPTAGRARRRKVAAVLAGGLVLGVGTMATLASWNDSEFASATFTAGKFIFQGSLDGTTYGDHASSPGAPLVFTTPLVGNLTPGDTVAVPFAVRLGAGTTNNANITIAAPTSSSVVTNLTWELIDTGSSFGCTASTSGTSIVGQSAFISGSGSFALAKGATLAADGATKNLCFKVTAGPSLVQSQTGSATWQLQAVSQ
jgi:predicted ribosomally synthesized peptide with SipW-like signal peptide